MTESRFLLVRKLIVSLLIAGPSRRFSRSADNPGTGGAAAFCAGWAQNTVPKQVRVALQPAIRKGDRLLFFSFLRAPLPAANSILYPGTPHRQRLCWGVSNLAPAAALGGGRGGGGAPPPAGAGKC